MRHFLAGPLPDHARNLLRRIGYAEHRGRDGQTSFTKRLHPTPYPRWHAYVEDRDGGVQINLHLDQKQGSNEGFSAHGGEYDGPIVEREMARVVGLIRTLPRAEHPPAESPEPRKNSWWNIFS